MNRIKSVFRSTAAFALGAVLLLCAGCFEDDTPRGRLRTHLLKYVNGEMSANTDFPNDTCLRRLDASDDRYIYLHHHPAGTSISVYWFGEDANLPAVRLRPLNGNWKEYSVADWRFLNVEALRTGEPQFAAIDLGSQEEVAKIVGIELVWERTDEAKSD